MVTHQKLCEAAHCTFYLFRTEGPASSMPRTQPSTLTGEWRVFYISAVPILETDVDTGVLRPSLGAQALHC